MHRPTRYADHGMHENFARWPHDQRAADAEEKLQAALPTLPPLTWVVQKHNQENPHNQRGYRGVHEPPGKAEMELHGLAYAEWLALPDPEPRLHRGLRPTPPDVINVPPDFLAVHNSFSAPLASDEWKELVNWRRREGARGRLAFGEEAKLLAYIRWAEEAEQDMKGRGRQAYIQQYNGWMRAHAQAGEESRRATANARFLEQQERSKRIREEWLKTL